MQGSNIDRLLQIMAKLRHPQDGCPWDLAQDFKSIVPFTLEEAYEVADTIERMAWDELPDELGDLLFQVVFYCQLGKEQGRFDFEQVAGRICDKLTHRHPHVFGELKNLSSEEIKSNWEQLKAEERAEKDMHSVLDNIPKSLPALSRAAKIQKRVARVGFDWDNTADVVAKIHEEVDEVLAEVNVPQPDKARVQDEMGDLLFAVVNLARHLGIEPEQALRQGNDKFERRFRQVEQLASESGLEMTEHTLEQLEAYWQQAKAKEAK